MRNRFMDSIVAAVALLAFAPGMLSQTAQQSGAARTPPDLSGIWTALPGGDIPGFGFTREAPPMLPWAEARYKAAREGTRTPFDHPKDDVDPNLHCIPVGPTRIFTISGRPIEIIQTPSRVLLLFEWDHQMRRIYLDGRKMPDGYPPSYMGYSTGQWDGDTLVVETIGLNDLTWIDSLGHPHSDALRIVERFRRVNHDTLGIDFLFDDPKAYATPWTGKKILRLRPDWEFLEHTVCEDHLLEDHLPKMPTRTIGPH